MFVNAYLCSMIYPTNFESKIGFDKIRELLKARCLSTLGKEQVDALAFCTDPAIIGAWLEQTREMRRIQQEDDNFPLQYFFDMRQAIARIRLENTHLEEDELFDLRRSLETIIAIVRFLAQTEGDDDDDAQGERQGQRDNEGEAEGDDDDSRPTRYRYPALQELTRGVVVFPQLLRRIDQILDKLGHIRDNASPALAQIRSELRRTEGSISHTLASILRAAQSEGVVDKDVAPTLRDGRLVIPVAPGLKRKIKGIVHDESATGRTVFIEPTEVVEANNRIRELESEERKEVIRILSEVTREVRPHVKELLAAYGMLAKIDLVRAKAELAKLIKAIEPQLQSQPYIDWIGATHPLLRLSLEKQGKQVVPLDIILTPQKRMLIISGPNAGGKSVCLKTVGLLQYMLQCGLSIPVGERSKAGIFEHLMIDIGDEQSIENDLSTYSSHLLNMKNMMKTANTGTLLLIDEFGTGTEPQIGGAIAEAVLEQFCDKQAWGVITTHYQNLKHYADAHPGVVNGAMLYDRHEMQALFKLAIGQPGSSFAIEIARKTGIPETVISKASDIVGTDYIQSDKYLQDIVRDKRYWENKRQTIHQREKDMEKTIARYENDIREVEQERKLIIKRAKEQADELFRQSNKRIENAIREIREQQAEKEATRRIREDLKVFEQGIKADDSQAPNGTMSDEQFAKKVEQIRLRKERKEKRKAEKAKQQQKRQEEVRQAADRQQQRKTIAPGDRVRIIGLTTIGTVEQVEGDNATVIFGDMRTKMRASRLEHAVEQTTQPTLEERLGAVKISKKTRDTIDEHRKNFHQDLDVRGMRGDEALNAVQYFIDDAILMGMDRVRILHGKGNGILRQLIRDYLSGIPNVTGYRDEHVQFGGAGITVVEL